MTKTELIHQPEGGSVTHTKIEVIQPTIHLKGNVKIMQNNSYNQGRIEPPKAARGHATLVHPV